MQRDRRRGVWRLALAAAVLGAATAWAQSRAKCGPAQAGCGPASVVTAGTTTTTLPAGAGSWVPSMVAAWMVDEASGNRVNLQGTTTRNLAPGGVFNANVTQNTSTFQEGIASVNVGNNACLTGNDAAFDALTAFTVGCWERMQGAGWIIDHYVGNTGGFSLEDGSQIKFSVADGTVTHQAFAAGSANNVWTHLVGSYVTPNLILYANGTQRATSTATAAPAATHAFQLGSLANYFAGQLDECFVYSGALSAASICRICSCGIRGEQCACAGTAFSVTGRNVAACGSCTLPADCTAGPS